MKIKDKSVKDVTIVSIEGSIDALTAHDISTFMNDLIGKGRIKLVADFSGVDYTSSAGLRVLLAAVKETRSKGGDLYLTGIQPDVQKVLNLSGFSNILKIFDDSGQAVKNFS